MSEWVDHLIAMLTWLTLGVLGSALAVSILRNGVAAAAWLQALP